MTAGKKRLNNAEIWNKTSILLPEEIMEDCHVGAFFQKTIKNYNYFGTTPLDKTAGKT